MTVLTTFKLNPTRRPVNKEEPGVVPASQVEKAIGAAAHSFEPVMLELEHQAIPPQRRGDAGFGSGRFRFDFTLPTGDWAGLIPGRSWLGSSVGRAED